MTSTDEEGSELDATDLQFMMGEGSDEFSGGEEGEESGTDSDGSGEYIFYGRGWNSDGCCKRVCAPFFPEHFGLSRLHLNTCLRFVIDEARLQASHAAARGGKQHAVLRNPGASAKRNGGRGQEGLSQERLPTRRNHHLTGNTGRYLCIGT